MEMSNSDLLLHEIVRAVVEIGSLPMTNDLTTIEVATTIYQMSVNADQTRRADGGEIAQMYKSLTAQRSGNEGLGHGKTASVDQN